MRDVYKKHWETATHNAWLHVCYTTWHVYKKLQQAATSLPCNMTKCYTKHNRETQLSVEQCAALLWNNVHHWAIGWAENACFFIKLRNLQTLGKILLIHRKKLIWPKFQFFWNIFWTGRTSIESFFNIFFFCNLLISYWR